MTKTTGNTIGKTIAMIFGIAGVCILLAAGWSFWNWNASQRVSNHAKAGRVETGMASYYADVLHGNPTASGESYDKTILTAAHREHPFGTRVRVTNLKNGKSVIVRINDRGPRTPKRIVDISGQAAQEIDLITMGTTEVELEVLQ